jgi:hypothetical protein
MDVRILVEHIFEGDDVKEWFASHGKRFPGSYVVVEGRDYNDDSWLVLEKGVPANTPLGEGSTGIIMTDVYRCAGRDYWAGDDFGLLAFVSRQGHVYPLLRPAFGRELQLSEMWPIIVSSLSDIQLDTTHVDEEEDVLSELEEEEDPILEEDLISHEDLLAMMEEAE